MFEYIEPEKKGLDAYTVMARAIKRHYDDDETKISPAMARTMAKIIDDGFLDGVIAEQGRLIEHQKRILCKVEDEVKKESYKLNKMFRDYDTLVSSKEHLERYLLVLKKLSDEEEDPFLLGAKKAYHFIVEKTGDEDKASKAFNSYLQGIGKWKQYKENGGRSDV